MSVMTKRVMIGSDHRIHLNLDLNVPPSFPEGEAEVVVDVKPLASANSEKPKNGLRALFGKYRGQCWMSDDFDAPLEDFSEYM